MRPRGARKKPTPPFPAGNTLHRVATRREAERGAEQRCFVEGCPATWRDLPLPEGPIVVGLDGGFVRNWEDKQNHFEVIAGKSVPDDLDDRDDRFFGFVQTHDTKPKPRHYEFSGARACR